MKLRNKKTGEIIDVYKGQVLLHYNNGRKTLHFKSLEELEEWEDYEEPKEFFAISPYKKEGYEVFPYDNFGHIYELAEELGIAFKTKEEAEKAVKKLKAWKRLKDKGFEFTGVTRLFDGDWNKITFNKDQDETWIENNKADLDLLFGGEK